MPLVVVLIGQFCRDVIGQQDVTYCTPLSIGVLNNFLARSVQNAAEYIPFLILLPTLNTWGPEHGTSLKWSLR